MRFSHPAIIVLHYRKSTLHIHATIMKIIAKSTLHIARHIVYVRPTLQAPRWGARAPLSRPRAGYALQTILAGKRPVGARARRCRDRAQEKIHFSAHFFRCARHVLRRFSSAALGGWLRPQSSAVYAHVPNGQTPPGHGHEEFYQYAVFAASSAGAAFGGASAPPKVRSSYFS